MKIAEDFDAFVAIVDAGSISEAARVLGTPRATVSRQLARLEQRLGNRLLHRTTRRLVPTPAGETLYARARPLLEAAQAAVESVQRLDDTPRGPLRVSSAPLHTPVLGKMMGEFMAAYPEVTVDLQTTSRHVDLVAEHIDVAMRGGVTREPSLIARPLLRTELLAVASPQYLERAGAPGSTDALAEHTCLRGFDGGSRPATVWPLCDGGTVAVTGPFVTTDIMALLGATLVGTGIALMPRAIVDAELQRGDLDPVLEGVLGRGVSLSVVWVEREFIEPKVRAFVEFAVEWAKAGRLLP